MEGPILLLRRACFRCLIVLDSKGSEKIKFSNCKYDLKHKRDCAISKIFQKKVGASLSKNSLVDVHRCIYLCWWCCCTNPSGTFLGWNGVGACFSPLEQDRPASTGTPNLRWSIRLIDFKLDFDYSVGFAIRNLVLVVVSLLSHVHSNIDSSPCDICFFSMIYYIFQTFCAEIIDFTPCGYVTESIRGCTVQTT